MANERKYKSRGGEITGKIAWEMMTQRMVHCWLCQRVLYVAKFDPIGLEKMKAEELGKGNS